MSGLRRITAGLYPPMACFMLKIQVKVKSFRGGLPAAAMEAASPHQITEQRA
jgi:hypothetical protein